jgi:hypothetical protein
VNKLQITVVSISLLVVSVIFGYMFWSNANSSNVELQQMTGDDFTNEANHRKILTRWSEGDFTQADNDHNAIWKLQKGNIGEATRPLTPEEELKFVEETFKQN